MVDFCLKNFSFSYPGQKKKALDNVSLTINRGEFIVLCGKSGSGKSTLLSMLKPELTPNGTKSGEISFFGKRSEDYTARESASDIGYLLQNTEYQTVTHSVRTELAFGPENLGLDSKTIRMRIAELSAYFSLDKIIDKRISELSGGQKQLVCLAGILAMHPKTVIFDEPVSQLDPMSADALFSTMKTLCRENGMTVIVTEHRLQNIIPMADRIIVLDEGKIIADCPPGELDINLFRDNEYINLAMPSPMRICATLGINDGLPLDVNGCRKVLSRYLRDDISEKEIKREKKKDSDSFAVEAKNVAFAYDKSGYVLKDFSLKVPENTFFALLGANGAGKSTAMSLMSGLLECKSGKIKIFGTNIKKYKDKELYNGTVAVLPQKSETLFSGNTVREDLIKALSFSKLSRSEKDRRITEVSELTKISKLLERHPYDLSGGEMQRAALSIVLLKSPRIIFMDEPTKGMDALFKKQFADTVKKLCKNGVTVIMVSHDTEFCAEYCDICAMISDGMCIAQAYKCDFFAGNFFYTTSANKIARDFFPGAVTEKEVIELCLKNLQK